MKKREEELNKNNKWRIKFIEKAGTKLKHILQNNDPFPEEICKDEKCLPCKSVTELSKGNRAQKSNCKKNNIGYRIPCVTCEEKNIVKVYEGESSRNARIRGEEHMRGFMKKVEGNPLFKHKMNDHPHEEVKFRMEVTKKFKDPLTRLANEGVRISSRPPGELLNSKSEFHQPAVVRLKVDEDRYGRTNN